MKKSKIKLADLKVDSFVTTEKAQDQLKGGTVTFVLLLFVSDDCKGYTEWSCESECTFSA